MPKLSIQPENKWFHQFPVVVNQKGSPSKDVVISLRAEAQNLLDSETKIYNKLKEKKQEKKDFAWISKIISVGTLSDKVSAYTLLIQDSAIYNIRSIDTLIGMVSTKGKRECLMAVDALRDLFIDELLIEDKKLKLFNEHPLEHLDEICKKNSVIRNQLLILWLFEDKIKMLYKRFLNNLDSVSRDTIEKTKMKAVTTISKLLKDNPEQEQWLLEHLVNKIGDPIPKVGSHSCYLLGQLLTQHSDMKGIVIKEVEQFIFRPNLPDRAKYYSLCFLNQIILDKDESDLANHLVMIYFGQFKFFVGKGEVDNKLMSALLTGVARAYPYAKLKDDVIMTQLDAMYKLVHVVSFNISIQALALIFQVLDSSDSVSDRFYSALYRKLLDPALASSSRQALLLNLVYKAIKKDVAIIRIKAFVKRLLQIALCLAPNLQCGILVLVSEVNRLHPNLMDVKRLFQEDSDSEEHYEDAPDESDDENTDNKLKAEPPEKKLEFMAEAPENETKPVPENKKRKSPYDFNCRNPLHANAHGEHMWELFFLRQSFHPSVSLFAHQVSKSTPIKYSGDPLLDFTMVRFLDRFVYRNPKKPSETFQSDPKSKIFGGRKWKAVSNTVPATNSHEFIHQRQDKVPIQERFIYDYLKNRTLQSKSDKRDSDMESVASDDFQQLLDGIHPEDDGDDFLNFAKELNTPSKKRKAENESDDDSLPSLSDYEGPSDIEEMDLEDVEEFDDFEGDFISTDTKKNKLKNKIADSSTNGKLLASAEEFSAMLEDNAGSQMDTTSGQAFKIKDKSNAKQIAWEVQRDRYVKGKKWHKKQKFGKKPKK